MTNGLKFGIKRVIARVIAFSGKTPEENVAMLRKKGISIGDNVHIYDSYIDSKYFSLIEIGNNVSISYASVLAHDASTKKPLGYTKIGKVHIGNDVFVGYGSIILPGTHIGNQCIIGAGSVVHGIIPDGSVACGNPAQIVGTYDEYIAKNRAKIGEELIFDENSKEDMLRAAQLLDRQYGFVK